MKAWLICLVLWTPAAAAQELEVFAAMVERSDGTPVSSATAVGGDAQSALYLVRSGLGDAGDLCLRVWSKGGCHPVANGQVSEVPGLSGLALVSISVPQAEAVAKISDIGLRILPRVGTFDPDSDGRALSFLTQTALGGWERPLDPATVTGLTTNGFAIQNPSLTELSVGAPVVHPEKGLVGVIGNAANGAAQVIRLDEIVETVIAAGFPMPPELRPKPSDGEELPRAVRNELGRLYVFQDYSYIGRGMTGFYGPSDGLGFSEDFVTAVRYSVFSVDLNGPSGALFAEGAKTVPLVPVGLPLEAPTRETPPDIVASCVVHATPSSGGRQVLVLQFWRAVPERYNAQIDDKSYDEAAPPVTGWAEGPSPCRARLQQLDPGRLAALRGEAVATVDTATPEEPWHWSTVDTGNGLNVSGTHAGTRANIFCRRRGDRVVGGLALMGDMMSPLASVDLSGGRLVYEVAGSSFSSDVLRSGSMVTPGPIGDGEGFVRALQDARKISLAWVEAGGGSTPLGQIDLTDAQDHLAAQRATCGLADDAPPAEAMTWVETGLWDATDQPAVSLSLDPGRKLILGCTESRELLVAIDPEGDVAGLAIGGRPATEVGRAEGMAYGFFPRAAFTQLVDGASIGFEIGGKAFDVPAPQALAGGAVGATCRE